MSDSKKYVKEEWTPQPGKQILYGFIAFLALIGTVALAIGVNWIAGAVFALICLVASFFVGRPKKSNKEIV